jgi:hypothetical protein
MFMRHFGHSVGHLQNERQHEIEPEDDINMGRTLDNVADLSDDLDTGDSDPGELEGLDAVDSDEEEAEYNGKNVRVNDEEGDSSDITISDTDSDRSDCDSDGYGSY